MIVRAFDSPSFIIIPGGYSSVKINKIREVARWNSPYSTERRSLTRTPRTEVIISWLNISKKPHAGSNPSEASGPHKREHGLYTHITEARFGSGGGKAYIHYNAIKIPRAKPRVTRTLILRPAAPRRRAARR